MSFRAARVPCVIALLLGAFLLVPVAAHADSVGKVRFVKEADTGFEPTVRAPSAEQAEWMRTHFWRQKTYAPYFDSRTSWYPNAWTYKDAYAIYTHGHGEVNADEHPEWVLEDAQGNRLYIPYACSGGTCPQYAGDIGDPGFRAQWIERIKATLAAGRYRGLFVDDVNMEMAVSNGNGDDVAPIDPRTGSPMTEQDWRRYMAEFVEQIAAEVRAAQPGIEIIHNQIWFAGPAGDPYIQRALLAADTQNLERGVNDDFSAGDGQFALSTFFRHIDWLHGRGKSVVLDSYADSQDAAEYNLAAYYLVTTPRDGFRTNYRNTPGDWWSAYDLDLGQARGDRYEWNGLWRRDFERGYAVVNPPGGRPRRLDLPRDARGPGGEPRSHVSLPAASGRVVVVDAPGRSLGTGAAAIVLRPVPNPAVGRPATERRLANAALVRGRVRGHRRAAKGRVLVLVQRKAKGRWRTVRRVRVRMHRKRFSRLFRGLPKGTYRVRATHRRPRGGVARSSRAFRVRH